MEDKPVTVGECLSAIAVILILVCILVIAIISIVLGGDMEPTYEQLYNVVKVDNTTGERSIALASVTESVALDFIKKRMEAIRVYRVKVTYNYFTERVT